MSESVTLPELSVTLNPPPSTGPGGFQLMYNDHSFTPVTPNFSPGYIGNPVTSSGGTNSGLAMYHNMESVLNKSGLDAAKNLSLTFSTLDQMSRTNGWSPEQTYFNAQLLGAQRQFRNLPPSQTLSGGPFSFAAAFVNYFGGTGNDMQVGFSNLQLNVKERDVPELRDLLKSSTAPGTYQFKSDKFGYQTYKDSVVTALYLGGIVLKAEGTLTINPDRTYSYSMDVSAAKPDRYDAERKPTGRRPAWYAEPLTTLLRNTPGAEFDIYINGNQNYSGSGRIEQNMDGGSLEIGDDHDNLLSTPATNHALFGGKGDDTYLIYNAQTAVREALGEGTDSVVTYVSLNLSENVENLFMANGAITAAGNSLDNIIFGNDESNIISGMDGRDFIRGEDGADIIYGNTGDDELVGAAGADKIYAGQGQDVVSGGADGDTILGNIGHDTILGGAGSDEIFGNQDNDQIFGNQDNDRLYGGQGDDTIYGGQGDDLLSGNIGNDILSGNLGADRFLFESNSGMDIITDFNQNQGDKINLSGQAYNLTISGAGNALLVLSGGGSVELIGIQPQSVSSNFFA